MRRFCPRVFLPMVFVMCLSTTLFPPSQAASDDIATLTGRITDSLLPLTPEDRQAQEDQTAQAARSLGADGSWPDIDYKSVGRAVWKAAGHVTRVDTMAKVYRTPGQPLYQDPALKAKTLLALSYWLDRDFQNPNWWWNQIGIPQHIGEILLLMKADLTPDQIAKGVVILQRSKLSMTGANLVWVAGNQIERGCLMDDPVVIQEAFTRLYQEINADPKKSDGLRPDLSFHQHGRQLYSGGYGSSFAGDCARFTVFGWGTRFQIPDPQLQTLIAFLLDGQQWIRRGVRTDYSTVGREITRAVPVSPSVYRVGPAGDTPLPQTPLGRLAALPVPRRQELAADARRAAGMSDPAPLTGNRCFWDSDYMAHQRPAFLATVKLLSKRMQNGEVVNGEGLRSQFLSYGATFVYQTGHEYDNIFPVWDWRRVPGTTCEQPPGPLDSKQVAVRGTTVFDGGGSDGLYGLAVQDLAVGNVTGHKAWFYFDSGFFCLGAGLTCPTPNPLLTSVNQCLRQGDVTASGQTQPLPPGEHALPKTEWVWHQNVGYVFPGGASVHVANQPQTGRWSDIGAGSPALVTKDVFSLWLDHGINTAQASYAYGVLPGCPQSEVAQRAAPIEVVQNTDALQAVTDRRAQLLEAAFWKPGLVKTSAGTEISVNQPCLLLMQRLADGHVRLTVADPAHQPLIVEVTLNGAYHGPDCTTEGGKTLVRMALPAGPEAGKSLTHILTSG